MNNNENTNQNVIPNIQPTPINPMGNSQQNTVQPTTEVQSVQQPIPVQPSNVTTNIEPVQPTVEAPQPIPVQPNNIATNIESVQPITEVQNVQQPIPVQPVVQPSNVTPNIEPTQPTTNDETIQSSVVEEIPSNAEDMSDVADITFDYNQIYGVQNNNQDTEEKLDVVEKPMFTAQEVEIKVNDLQNRTSKDVVPEFNINALNENVSKEDSKLTDTVLNDKQQDKQNTRRAIIWIAVLVLILVIFVGFIFPIINGYKF